jgi:hypothetical protein
MKTTTISVTLESAEDALVLGDLSETLERISDRGSRWAVSGPGVTALRNGIVDHRRLSVIGSGAALLDAPRIAAEQRVGDPQGVAPGDFDMDIAFTPKRLRFDRRSVSRAYRFALNSPETLTLEVSGTTVVLPVLRPFDAYIVELARYHEAPRGSAARVAAGDRALELYQNLGATRIDDELHDLQLLSGHQLDAAGLRRRDVDAFKAWHRGFLKERSPKARPPMGGRFVTGLRGVGAWASGADLQQPEPPGR